MMEPEIAIIVVDRQTPDLTVACLRSLEAEVDEDCQVVVVERGPVDDSLTIIANAITDWGFDAWARVLPAPGPRARGDRPRQFDALPTKGYVVIDGRTTVAPGAIRELRKAMTTHPEAGLLGARVLDGDERGQAAPVDPDEVRAAPAAEGPREVTWVSRDCRLIRHGLLDTARLLDDGDEDPAGDAELRQAVLRTGLKVLHVPSARVVRRRDAGAGATAAGRPGPLRDAGDTAGQGAGPWRRISPVIAAMTRRLDRAWQAARPAVSSATSARRPASEGSDVSGASVIRSPARVTGHADMGDDPHAGPLPRGDKNLNPSGISLANLLREDFRTYDHDPLAPGFWAVALHRFGNLRMDFPQPFRAPATALYRTGARLLDLMFGIDLPYTVKLGRRVRIWYHGDIRLGARAIGDDVHIRHNTTFGLVSRGETTKKPIIGDRVDVGTGVCILGDVTIGHDSVIGANSVVVRSFPPHSVLFGVPARPVGAPVAAPESRPFTGPSAEGVLSAVRRVG